MDWDPGQANLSSLLGRWIGTSSWFKLPGQTIQAFHPSVNQIVVQICLRKCLFVHWQATASHYLSHLHIQMVSPSSRRNRMRGLSQNGLFKAVLYPFIDQKLAHGEGRRRPVFKCSNIMHSFEVRISARPVKPSIPSE